MRLLVVGAGSTGGYIGGRLAQEGQDVTFLVRRGRAERLRRDGLRIVSPLGDATVEPQLVTADTLDETFDVVLLSVKGFQLDAALDDLGPAVGPDTMILPVLNGMRHMEILARRFSAGNLVGCALKIATMLDDEGRVVHLSPLQDLAYGELDGGTTRRIQALHELIRAGGFQPRLSREIRREMWEKWILLATIGAVTCLMRGPIGEIEAAPGGPAFALAVLDEAVATVRAIGTGPSEAFLTATRDQLTAKGSPLTSSMYRDLLNGRQVEVENIIGDLVRAAAGAGIETPLLAAAYTHLSVFQNRLGNA
ncbi:2-dehydropantoate 2-reductase [Methylobacterium sp. Leaf361]|uniref:ketopantoate reductase family protein n=1 Tax=Methylobacterium sp. Leaf361 TaxID=1736352 RepID=UPI0006F92803|nr:ketopantoate reductase family protein [Methylobacterium sp. Leaf361]KQS74279.1 2-dehydropantoate 2-reductase [Methylobacterium sp. Leaf361]